MSEPIVKLESQICVEITTCQFSYIPYEDLIPQEHQKLTYCNSVGQNKSTSGHLARSAHHTW